MTKKKPAGEKLSAGRPTDYQPKYGEHILGLMSEGLSLAASAADINVSRQTVYNWLEKHPEFLDTISVAKVKRQLFLERRLLAAEQSPIVTSTIFALKNAAGDDWREKQDIEHSGKVEMDESPSEARRKAALALLLARQG